MRIDPWINLDELCMDGSENAEGGMRRLDPWIFLDEYVKFLDIYCPGSLTTQKCLPFSFFPPPKNAQNLAPPKNAQNLTSPKNAQNLAPPRNAQNLAPTQKCSKSCPHPEMLKHEHLRLRPRVLRNRLLGKNFHHKI